MITRIVKMTFKPENTDGFLEVFSMVEDKIRSFPGCKGMKLMRDIKNPALIFTYSIWDSEEDLEKYRKSDLFVSTWAKTKELFAEKAEAWTLRDPGD